MTSLSISIVMAYCECVFIGTHDSTNVQIVIHLHSGCIQDTQQKVQWCQNWGCRMPFNALLPPIQLFAEISSRNDESLHQNVEVSRFIKSRICTS
jgi:hypothetical protein